MALTSVGYKNLGREAARRGDRLLWVSAPTAWQEKARKEGYEAEKDLMREERIKQHQAEMAALSEPVEVNAKGNPMRKRRASVTGAALEQDLKAIRHDAGYKKIERAEVRRVKPRAAILRATEEQVNGPKTKMMKAIGDASAKAVSGAIKVTKDKDPGVGAKQRSYPENTIHRLEGELHAVQEDHKQRIKGMEGALNATRQSVESSKARNEQLQTIIDGQKLDISRLERQRTYERQKKEEQSATEAANARSLADGFTMLQVLSPMLSTARQKATLGAVMAYLRQINPELGQERIEPEPKPAVAPMFKDRVFVPGDEVMWSIGDRHYEGIVKYRPHIEPGMVEVLGRATRDGKTILSPKPELSMAQVRVENLRLMKRAQDPEKVPSPEFKVGDRVQWVDFQGNNGTFTRTGTVHDVETYARSGEVVVKKDQIIPPKPSPLARIHMRDLKLIQDETTLPSHFKMGDKVRFRPEPGGAATPMHEGNVIDISESGDLLVRARAIYGLSTERVEDFTVPSPKATRVNEGE